MSKGRAYRRWKSFSKYISRLKKNVHKWLIYEPSENRRSLYRDAMNWKDLDENGKFAKQLKDTVTKYTHTYDKIQRHQKVKKSRRESKKRIDEEMSII